MQASRTDGPGILAPLIIVGATLALRFVPGWVSPVTLIHFITLGLGPLVGLLAMLIWWLLARRVPFGQRLVGFVLAAALLAAGWLSAHPTMWQTMITHAVPTLLVLFTAALVLSRSMVWPSRRWLLVVVIALGILPWNLLRQEGQAGDLAPELTLRWRATAEEQFLARLPASTEGTDDAAAIPDAEPTWPGYRGPSRDARVSGVSFDTAWDVNPPREIWRRPVGPGWSSFAVAGDRVFTQEQRGDAEVIVSYSLDTGAEIWTASSTERFEEPASGAGPRATPTIFEGLVYALGANGTLQCLDAGSGDRLWQRNLRDDVGAPLPTWGFCSSPLVMGDVVAVVAVGGDGKAVAAYDRRTGDLEWTAGDGALSYSSVHPASIAGVDQLLVTTDVGLQALVPGDGTVLWEQRWQTTQMPRMVQPVILEDTTSVIFATGYGYGARRVDLDQDGSGVWSAREAWTSRYLKPYFNGLVCHRGSCYGFDNRIFTCIDADDGERCWKGGRYGHGQVLLLADMDLLLVLTEQGEVVLVEATPEAHREVTRFAALTGKTWNHPVVTQGRLLVRNAEEAVCFDLPGFSEEKPE